MNKKEQSELLDSLTESQRQGIAKLILATHSEGDYRFDGEDSVFEEDTEATLKSLSRVFSSHDPCMATD